MLRSNQLSYATVTRKRIISPGGGRRASLFSRSQGPRKRRGACLRAGSSQSRAKMDHPVTAAGPRVADERLIRLTAAAGAKARVLSVREGQGDYLRVAITGGGCNGLSYKMR